MLSESIIGKKPAEVVRAFAEPAVDESIIPL
jgi:hypothetical protein